MLFEKNGFSSTSRCDCGVVRQSQYLLSKGDLESAALTHSDLPQGIRVMNIQNLKKYAFSLALALGFVIAPSLSTLGAVQAQDWGRNRWDDDRRDERRRDRDDRWDDRREHREEHR